MALYSIVADLAEREGISPEEFLRHYETRFRWWLDRSLRKLEEKSQSLAAQIDMREIAECEVPERYPPLFDDQPPTHST